jgi:hypothetical protein
MRGTEAQDNEKEPEEWMICHLFEDALADRVEYSARGVTQRDVDNLFKRSSSYVSRGGSKPETPPNTPATMGDFRPVRTKDDVDNEKCTMTQRAVDDGAWLKRRRGK